MIDIMIGYKSVSDLGYLLGFLGFLGRFRVAQWVTQKAQKTQFPLIFFKSYYFD